eukprot:7312013-Pyramimonas_sp.AAC.1
MRLMNPFRRGGGGQLAEGGGGQDGGVCQHKWPRGATGSGGGRHCCQDCGHPVSRCEPLCCHRERLVDRESGCVVPRHAYTSFDDTTMASTVLGRQEHDAEVSRSASVSRQCINNNMCETKPRVGYSLVDDLTPLKESQ